MISSKVFILYHFNAFFKYFSMTNPLNPYKYKEIRVKEKEKENSFSNIYY